MPRATVEINPLPGRKFECSLGKAEDHAAFEAVQRDWTLNPVRINLHAGVEDEPHDFKCIGSDDRSRSERLNASPSGRKSITSPAFA